MPNYKRSGFKMKGYSYPGTSPMKGKKADKLAASEKKEEAMAKIDEFADMKMKSTDLLAKDSFKVNTGSSPATKRSPAKDNTAAITKGFMEQLGESAAEAGVNAVIGEGAKLLTRKKEKPKRKAADQSGFAGIKFGTK